MNSSLWMKRAMAAGIAVVLATLTACSEPTPPPNPECREVVDQVVYETLAQLVESGLAANPEELRNAIPAEFREAEGGASVILPDFATFQSEFTPGERATLLSALSSRMFGVGDVFTVTEIYSSLDSEGALCEGDFS